MCRDLLRPGCTAAAVDPDLVALWLTVVHQAARQARARVTGPVVPPWVTHNYYSTRVTLAGGEEIDVLLNAAVGLVAAALRDGCCSRTFVPVPEQHVFPPAGLRAAAPEELDAPFDLDVSSWPKHERYDIRYHEPRRVGDVFFNWFD